MCQGPIKILGVLFETSNSASLNWTGWLDCAHTSLALWKARRLTLLEKVVVLKADVLSSLLHLAYIYPLPGSMRRLLTHLVFEF